MKNNQNYLALTVSFILVFFFSTKIFGDEIKLNASKIETYENNKLIKAFNDVRIEDQSGIIIESEELIYDKKKSIINAKGKVKIIDTVQNYKIETNEVIYEISLETLTTVGKTSIFTNTEHEILSSDIIYNKNKGIINSDKKTTIKDTYNNIINFNQFRLNILEKKLNSKNIQIIDNKLNQYNIKQALVNLKTNEIFGKDLAVDLSSGNFNSNKNQPRLKGNSIYLNKDFAVIKKGIFTTCEKRKGCPPWTLSSDKIIHDKKKKIIKYDNSVLKLYDKPVFYFPSFFHPDPTVKRQSGFLMPTLSNTSTIGSYFSIPYYHVVNEASDLTLTPRIYDTDHYIFQGEHRVEGKNYTAISDIGYKNQNLLTTDSKKRRSETHLFSESSYDLEMSKFDYSNLNLKIQTTSNDSYLKLYKLKSPLIQSESTLNSSISFEANNEDLDFKIYSEMYETLGLSNGDRFEYVYPGIDFSKNLFYSKGGLLSLKSSASNKEYNTNVNEKILINDFSYKKYDSIKKLGLIDNYELLVKNFNAKTKNSSKFTGKNHNNLATIFNYEVKMPLRKIDAQYEKSLIPKISARYSPNKTANITNEDRTLNVDNIFSLNRIGTQESVEGGASITFGTEYSIKEEENPNNKILSLNLATVFRDEENLDLPKKTSLDHKTSDVFGQLEYNFNKSFNLKYDFSVDNDLNTINYNKITTELSINNFVTNFEFAERNNFTDSKSYFSNSSKLSFDDSNSLSFKTRKNKDTNLTEYYNLIYQYKNDCLVAGIEYNKNYYTDVNIKPEEELFFSVTIMPFGKINSINVNDE